MADNCKNQPYLMLMKTSKTIQDRIKMELQTYKLNITEFSVLEVLYLQGIQTIQQIVNSILISSGSMTYVIDKLEQRGLLKRLACPNDRRAIHVSLTDDGTELMEKIMPEHHKLVEHIFELFTNDDEDMFIKLLNKVSKRV